MKIVQQAQTLTIKEVDWTKQFRSGFGERIQDPLLPNSIRCITCGLSNCSKTKIRFNLMFDVNGLRFWNVYYFPNRYFSLNTAYWKSWWSHFSKVLSITRTPRKTRYMRRTKLTTIQLSRSTISPVRDKTTFVCILRWEEAAVLTLFICVRRLVRYRSTRLR